MDGEWRVTDKEYISVIEGTAPAIVLQRFDLPNLSLPSLSDGQVVQYTADRAERGLVSQIFVRLGGANPSIASLKYILWSEWRVKRGEYIVRTKECDESGEYGVCDKSVG